MSSRFVIVIPARMQSTRLPGKPLIDLEGKSMIVRTYEQCAKAVDPEMIYVATDAEEIRSHCASHGMQVVMTSTDCLTGTDRVAEVASQVDADYYVNVQGDEPLFNPEDIKKTIACIDRYDGEVINGYAEITRSGDYMSTSVPKVVLRPDGRLLYMSRSPIPGNKIGEYRWALRQICIYAFPKAALQDFAKQGEKTPLEAEEDIEILRFLELGYEVRMVRLSTDSIAVDHPEDAERVRAMLRQKTTQEKS